MKKVATDLHAYITNNYGQCQLPVCLCRERRWWLGKKCPNWSPVTAANWEELSDEQQKG